MAMSYDGAAVTTRAEMTGLRLNSSTIDGAQLDVHLRIENPHPSAIDLLDIEFLFENEDEDGADENLLVKVVEHPYEIQPCSSEVMVVPLNLVYRDIVERRKPISGSVQAGQVIPCTMKANLNCRHTICGVFKVSAQKLKHFFTVGSTSADVSTPSFIPPTGYVNGMHIVAVSPTKVDFELVLRVKNSNNLSVELMHADFQLQSEGKQMTKRVTTNINILGQSSKRVVVPLSFSFRELSDAGFDLKAGGLLPFNLKMEFNFKQSHGTYKILQQKSGNIPVLQVPVFKVETMVFERDADKKAVARVTLMVDNSKNKISYVVTKLRYVIQKAGSTVASADYHGDEIQISDKSHFELISSECDHPDFGSALWEAFTGSESVYKPLLILEAKSSEYGRIIVP